jgi:hypothetical protein
VLGLQFPNHPSPKSQRLGVRVIHPEYLHPALNPELQDF